MAAEGKNIRDEAYYEAEAGNPDKVPPVLAQFETARDALSGAVTSAFGSDPETDPAEQAAEMRAEERARHAHDYVVAGLADGGSAQEKTGQGLQTGDTGAAGRLDANEARKKKEERRLHDLLVRLQTLQDQLVEIEASLDALDQLEALYLSGEFDLNNPRHAALLKRAGISREDWENNPMGAMNERREELNRKHRTVGEEITEIERKTQDNDTKIETKADMRQVNDTKIEAKAAVRQVNEAENRQDSARAEQKTSRVDRRAQIMESLRNPDTSPDERRILIQEMAALQEDTPDKAPAGSDPEAGGALLAQTFNPAAAGRESGPDAGPLPENPTPPPAATPGPAV